jgi:tripartite-type tricarboxylate transporter receptor subunit TctC
MTLDLAGRRKPAFKLPASACDAHCHVFGPGAERISKPPTGVVATSAVRAEDYPSGPVTLVVPFTPGGSTDFPDPIVQRLNAEVCRALASPDLVAKLAHKGAEPWATSPAEFHDLIVADIARWGKLIRDNGLQVQ